MNFRNRYTVAGVALYIASFMLSGSFLWKFVTSPSFTAARNLNFFGHAVPAALVVISAFSMIFAGSAIIRRGQALQQTVAL